MIIDDSCPTSVIVGAWEDSLEKIGLNGHTLLITSGSFWCIVSESKIVSRLRKMGRLTICSGIKPNPDLAELDGLIKEFSNKGITNIVALGGGSVIDTAKALSLFISCSCTITLEEHLKGGKPLDEDMEVLPLVSIPTTAGTGSEVTPFATVWDRYDNKKFSIQHNSLYSDVAILDSRLLKSIPKDIGISAALDTLSHAFEAVWNRNATPSSTKLATTSLQLSLSALSRDVFTSLDLNTLSKLQLASLYAGVAIAKTKTGLAHSISYPLTLRYGISHGIACSFMLPSLLEFNAKVDDGRLSRLSSDLGYGNIEEMKKEIANLIKVLNVRDAFLSILPSKADEILGLGPVMMHKGRAENNMRKASVEDVKQILESALSELLSQSALT